MKPVDNLPTVSSRHNPVVARFRTAARGESSSLLLDGIHVLAEALDARLAIREVAVARGALEHEEIAELIDRCHRQGVPMVVASAPVMSALSPTRSSSPIVGLADRPAAREEQIYRQPSLAILLLDVQDPGNVGAMIRAAEAFGATGVIAAGASADPFGWKALRGSMGSALRLPIGSRRERGDAVAEARRHGCRIFATVPRGGRAPAEADLSMSSAILIGGEGAGLTGEILSSADEHLTIPMQPPVESLNAAITAAIVLYEACRQRRRQSNLQSASTI